MSRVKHACAPVAVMPHTDSARPLPVQCLMWGWKALAIFCCADLETSARSWHHDICYPSWPFCQRSQSLKLNRVASIKNPTKLNKRQRKKEYFSEMEWFPGFADVWWPKCLGRKRSTCKGTVPGGMRCREGSGCSTAKLRVKQAPGREGGIRYTEL